MNISKSSGLTDSGRAVLAAASGLERRIAADPSAFRILTGDRPTGPLHVGHIFGSVRNRVRLQNLGVETFVLIADYQVLTDRDDHSGIAANILELAADYIALGMDPARTGTSIFCHSGVPELNQLLLPFLGLVSMNELIRNPTVKEEIRAGGLKTVKAGMFVYPVHQAADILSMKANLVPVGADQLPHLELVRTISRRFNNAFCPGTPLFPEPEALLGEVPRIAGLDGTAKMGKSRANSINLGQSADETADLIRSAKTDSDRRISFDPEKRPEVANLLLILSLVLSEDPFRLAERLEHSGSAGLKKLLIEAVNAYLEPARRRRRELLASPDHLAAVLRDGGDRARALAGRTLRQVRSAMNMDPENFTGGKNAES